MILPIVALAVAALSLLINLYLLVKIKDINNDDYVLKSWSRLTNPNSYESKQLKRNMQSTKRG